MAAKKQRRGQIREWLVREGRLKLADLAARLGVALMTVRRDLEAMELAGLLTRTHGGCILQSPFVSELPFAEKERRQRPQKNAIASETVKLLKPGQAVYLDTGTTTLHVARALPPGMKLRIFTCNLRLALELFGRPDLELFVLGGQVGAQNPDCVGEWTVNQIRQFHFDVAVVGGDALGLDTGEFYSADLATVAISRAAQQQAEEVIAVMDSSKTGHTGVGIIGRLGPDMTLVTDTGLSPADRRQLTATGVRLVLAKCTPTQEAE